MSEDTYTISQAAKLVEVESHVLRFWEEELRLDIGRNAKGYRIYTKENIETLKHIKELKKTHALKNIKDILGDKGKRRQQFFDLMERVITATREEQKSPEQRYKQVDETIRHKQNVRKLIAATTQNTKKSKRTKKRKIK